jgi:glycosyltransferase involved in cell wall biosynthesis
MISILSRFDKNIFDISVCAIANQYTEAVIKEYRGHDICTKIFPEQPGIALIFALRKYIEDENFNIVHTHHYLQNMYGRIAAILARVPNILTYSHNWSGGERSRHRLAFKCLNMWTKKNIAVSGQVGKYLIEKTRVSSGKVFVIDNGVDLDIYRVPVPIERMDARRALGISRDNIAVGFASRLVDWKRPDLFVRSALVAAVKNPALRFFVVGNGEMRPKLEKLSKELGINSKIKFLGWVDDMSKIYCAMDIFTVLSESGSNRCDGEGFGLVSAEAAASGLPIVAIDNIIYNEVLGADAALFCSPSEKEIADRLCFLSENPNLRDKLGRAARRRAEEKFNIEDTVKKLVKVYTELVGRSDCVGGKGIVEYR